MIDNTEDLWPRGILLISRENNGKQFHIHIDWYGDIHEDYFYEPSYIDGSTEPFWNFIE